MLYMAKTYIEIDLYDEVIKYHNLNIEERKAEKMFTCLIISTHLSKINVIPVI
jgi:hypothetical protein